MLAVGALFVVVKGIEKCKLLDVVSRRIFGLNTSISMGLLRMMSGVFVLSAFLNNTPIGTCTHNQHEQHFFICCAYYNSTN